MPSIPSYVITNLRNSSEFVCCLSYSLPVIVQDFDLDLQHLGFALENACCVTNNGELSQT